MTSLTKEQKKEVREFKEFMQNILDNFTDNDLYLFISTSKEVGIKTKMQREG